MVLCWEDHVESPVLTGEGGPPYCVYSYRSVLKIEVAIPSAQICFIQDCFGNQVSFVIAREL